jgi:hypothetical protein
MSDARYSQPLPSTPRTDGGQIVHAGFVNGEPGFIVRELGQREVQKPATSANRANEQPRGFLQSLARIMFGGFR